ncbi:GntR family transcriptional regulator [Sansalvadorimonas verongulae]|uniref:GntR family transcriptional regulator n=1 Tax=Sansalvadorimonas verongulae TaxID=2172824 RepID=UPI0012BCEA7F|nr:GntR family transcriptional regulator [Sansalvadorimonas verongulae]MTI12604.1 GntR family transcriptional regulator [Sansalvadorimonas verongulae]
MSLEVSLTEAACEQLERMIIFQKLAPGAMYSEKKLAEAVGMGRTPVREALQKLAWEQMVVIHPRRGVQIPDITVENQLKLLEVRRPLEALCAKLAAERATAEQKLRMTELAVGILQCAGEENEKLFLEYLRGCHDALVDAARNEYISKVMRPLQGPSRIFWFRHQHPLQHVETVHPAQLHANIMNCVADGDASGAEAASHALVEYLRQFAVACLHRA